MSERLCPFPRTLANPDFQFLLYRLVSYTLVGYVEISQHYNISFVCVYVYDHRSCIWLMCVCVCSYDPTSPALDNFRVLAISLTYIHITVWLVGWFVRDISVVGVI